jgi:acetolactate synthase-1/2/3 large subunit
VRAAIRNAVATPPGPVHLEIPADVLGLEVDDVPVYAEPQFLQVPGPRSAPDQASVQQATEILRGAAQPVILAGNGALLSGATAELLAVAEAIPAPVATTMGGKGVILDSHPLSLGVVGRYSRKVANDVLTEADVVLVVGSRLGGLATDSWRRPNPDARIIHVDADPAVLGATYREEIALLADAKLALGALADELQGGGDQARGWVEKVTSRVADWRGHVDDAASSSQPGALHPAQVVRAIREVTHATDVIVADTGYMGAWTGALLDVEETGRHYLRAAGSLGWAFPAAIGASLAAPDRNVVCVSGDGGIGYHLMELETARRLGAPVKIVVLNNVSLAFEYHDQRYLFGNRILPRVNDFVDIDYGAVARAMGVGGAQGHRAGGPGACPLRRAGCRRPLPPRRAHRQGGPRARHRLRTSSRTRRVTHPPRRSPADPGQNGSYGCGKEPAMTTSQPMYSLCQLAFPDTTIEQDIEIALATGAAGLSIDENKIMDRRLRTSPGA